MIRTSPAWTETKTRPNASTAWDTGWTRNVPALSGDLGLIVSSDGTAQIQLANLHDDVALTIGLSSSGATEIGSYSDYTEYGIARDPASTPDRYGWLGGKQRDASAGGGLTLMGARLYNPITGRFLSRDPVTGGNDNTYTYPVDPINKVDLNGEWGWKKILRGAGRLAWKYKYDIAFTAAGGGLGVAYRAYRVARVLKAARAAKLFAAERRAKEAKKVFRASRYISKRAGKKWAKKANHYYRKPGWKHNQRAYTSNFERHTKGSHLYSNFHVTHRRWF